MIFAFEFKLYKLDTTLLFKIKMYYKPCEWYAKFEF